MAIERGPRRTEAGGRRPLHKFAAARPSSVAVIRLPPALAGGVVKRFVPTRNRRDIRNERVGTMVEMVPMTVAGHAALEEELRRRQQEERPRIIQMISEARSHGDLSENAEYHAAKESQSLNEGRIAELEDKLSRAEVIDVSKLERRYRQIRRDRDARRRGYRRERKYQIVGEAEADVKSGTRLHHVADRARDDRQERRRHRGGETPGGGKSYEILAVCVCFSTLALPVGGTKRGPAPLSRERRRPTGDRKRTRCYRGRVPRKDGLVTVRKGRRYPP